MAYYRGGLNLNPGAWTTLWATLQKKRLHLTITVPPASIYLLRRGETSSLPKCSATNSSTLSWTDVTERHGK